MARPTARHGRVRDVDDPRQRWRHLHANRRNSQPSATPSGLREWLNI